MTIQLGPIYFKESNLNWILCVETNLGHVWALKGHLEAQKQNLLLDDTIRNPNTMVGNGWWWIETWRVKIDRSYHEESWTTGGVANTLLNWFASQRKASTIEFFGEPRWFKGRFNLSHHRDSNHTTHMPIECWTIDKTMKGCERQTSPSIACWLMAVSYSASSDDLSFEGWWFLVAGTCCAGRRSNNNIVTKKERVQEKS